MNPEQIVGPSWAPVIGEEFKKPYMKRISRIVRFHRSKYDVYPPAKQVMRAFHLTPYEQVKVVILGQDPYPTPGHANGLAFSFNQKPPPDLEPLPRSLRNIFTEVESDLGFTMYQDPDLTRWATQGVLLLNTALTVVKGLAGAHSDIGWRTFTEAVINKLNEKDNQIVYLLWGNHAKSFIPHIKRHHEYLASAHPSPLSAHKGFFGSRPFSNCNEILKLSGQEPINWTK